MKRRTLLGWAALTGALTVSRHALAALPDPESRSDASTASGQLRSSRDDHSHHLIYYC